MQQQQVQHGARHGDPCRPPAHGVVGVAAEAQASLDAIKVALSSPWRWCSACSDGTGRQHPVAYESRMLTAAERNYPAQVLETLAAVHALRVLKH